MKESPGLNTAKNLFKRYREYLLYFMVIFVCSVLFWQVILPQIQNWFLVIRDEEKATRDRIEILRNNINFLSKIDEENFNSQFQTASVTLPLEKDFVGILNAIGIASANSAVKVNDFVFYIGELSPKPEANLLPSLNVSLNISGGVGETRRFVEELSTLAPISDVANVSIEENKSDLQISFYYRPVSPITFQYTVPIKPLSVEDRSTLEKISSWKVASLELVPLSSPSASF